MRFLPVLLLLAAGKAAQCQQAPEPPPTFESLLKKIASAPADPCDWRHPDSGDRKDLEWKIFGAADKAVVAKLNETPRATPSGAKAHATEALEVCSV